VRDQPQRHLAPDRVLDADGGPALQLTELAAGDLAATWLPAHGMVGASLRHRGAELLGQRGGLAAYLGKGSAFGIPLLAPWANRLDGLRYGDVTLDPARVKGGAERLPKDGAMAGRSWVVEEATATTLAARFDAACDGYDDVLAVFPFAHAWRVVVTLTPAAMTVRTELSATGDAAVPVAFGWHPLFTLPGVARGELHVELPVRAESVLDARGIPEGPSRAPTWRDGPLADRALDSEYPELDDGADFVLRGGGRELRVALGAPDYPVGHAWAPAGEAFVAWEPMTAPTNALVSGCGLRHVAPGETFAATFVVRVCDV
jgi:galactose mutarotase-like enzyme